MSDSTSASLPAPPYYSVIFSSRRNRGDAVAYEATSQRMVELAVRQPGCLGVESCRDADGFGITVSDWTDEAAIRAWRNHAEHATARDLGRERWYDHYELRVARVERAYGSKPAP